MDAKIEKRRLFVGVPVPGPVVGAVRAAQDSLPRDPGLRLTPEERLHVTLCFLGEVAEEAVNAAARVVSELPCNMGGVVRLGGFVCLPSASRTRVVALAISDEGAVLARLYERLAGPLEREGVYARESRPFRPHLTIARLKQRRRLRLTADVPWTPFPIGSVCLYESVLSREGPEYVVLESTSFDD